MKLFSRLRKDVTDNSDHNTSVQAQSDASTDSTENTPKESNESNEQPKVTEEKSPETEPEKNKNNNIEPKNPAPVIPENDNDDSNNQLVSVHDQRVKIEHDMNNLSHEYAQLRGKLKLNLFSERDDYQHKLDQLNERLRDLEKTEEQLQEDIKNNKLEDDGKQKERLASVRADQRHQNELLYKFKEQQKNLAAEIEKNEKVLQKRQKLLDDNRVEETKLTDKIKNITDLQEMMTVMTKQKAEVDQIYKDRKKITKDIEDIQEKLNTDNDDLNDVNVNINEISSTIALLKTKVSQIDSMIKDSRSKRAAELNQLEASSKSNTNEIKGLKLQAKNVTENINYVDKYIKDVFHAAYLVREVFLEKHKQYIVLSDSIDKEQQETDLFDMVNYLETKLDNTVTLVTTFYNNKFSKIVDGYTKSMNIQRPNVLNLFDDLQKSSNPSDKKVSLPQNNDWVTRTDVKTHNTLVYEQDGTLLMTVEHMDEDIDRIHYYKNKKLVKTNIYNTDGILSATQTFGKDQKLTEENYFRTDGSIVMTINYESGVANDFQVFDGSGLLTQDFDKKEELVTWWIDLHYKDQSDLVYVGDSTDLLYKAVAVSRDQDKTDMITFVENAHSNIGRIKALLHKEPQINNIFVQYEKDLHAVENTTDRDISVSAIKTAVSDELYLPEALKI